jgi:hypothetical protein
MDFRHDTDVADAGGRVSPTAPRTMSVSAAVWDYLDSLPQLTEELHQAEADILAGKGTPYKELTVGR